MRVEAQRQSALSPKDIGQDVAVQNLEPESRCRAGHPETVLQPGFPVPVCVPASLNCSPQ